MEKIMFPCPFCGCNPGIAKQVSQDGEPITTDSRQHKIFCANGNCGIGQLDMIGTTDEVIAKWNQRLPYRNPITDKLMAALDMFMPERTIKMDKATQEVCISLDQFKDIYFSLEEYCKSVK